MEQCMLMNGGGPFRLSGGQITDDSELSMSMMWGLIDETIPEGYEDEEPSKKQRLYMDNIAKYYRDWFMSNPFDIGKNTTIALKPLVKKCFAKKAVKLAAKNNQESLSNGALMRCMPMAVYTSALKPEEAKEVMIAEIEISHPNKAVQDTIYLYQLAIHHLLNNPTKKDRAEKAFEIAYNSSDGLGEYISDRDASENSCKIWLDLAIELESEANKSGKLVNSPLPEELINCRKMTGWLQRAFVLSFYYLLRHKTYRD